MQFAVTRLRSPVFKLAPGEEALLLAHVQTRPFKRFRTAIHRPVQLNEAAFRWGVSLTEFYVFSLTALLFFFGFQGAMRNWLGVASGALVLSFLALIALVDGLLFRLFFPNHPEWHALAGFGVLFAISPAAFQTDTSLWLRSD